MKQYLLTLTDNLAVADIEKQITGGDKERDCKVEEVQGVGILSSAILSLRRELLTPVHGPIVFKEDEVKDLVEALIEARLDGQNLRFMVIELRKRLAEIRVELKGIRQEVGAIELLIPEVESEQE